MNSPYELCPDTRCPFCQADEETLTKCPACGFDSVCPEDGCTNPDCSNGVKEDPKPFRVNWDNGAEACGTFPYRFATEQEAQAFADEWANERNWVDLRLTSKQVERRGGEGCYTAEVIDMRDEVSE